MMKTFKSPIDLDYAFITKAEFYVSDSFDKGENDYSLEIGRPNPRPKVVINKDAERCELPYHLLIKYRVSNSNSDEELICIRLTIEGRVSVESSFARRRSDAEIASWMEANAISLLYAKAKACVEYLSAMSASGILTLPTIDPYAYMRGLEEDDQNA